MTVMWPRRKKREVLTRLGRYLPHEFAGRSLVHQVARVFDRVKSFHVASTLRQNVVHPEYVLEEQKR